MDAGAGVHRAGGERRRRRSDARRCRARAGGAARRRGCAASRACTRRRPSASSTSPSSATPSWRSTCPPVPIRPRGRSRCWSPSRASSGRSAASRAGAGARARSTSTCSCSGVTRSGSSGRREGRSADPAKAALPLVVPHAEARRTGCSCWRRSPTSPPGWCRPGWGETVGPTAARRRAAEGDERCARSRPGAADRGSPIEAGSGPGREVRLGPGDASEA